MLWTFTLVMLYGDCTWGCLLCIITSLHDMFIEDAYMYLANATISHDIDMYHFFLVGLSIILFSIHTIDHGIAKRYALSLIVLVVDARLYCAHLAHAYINPPLLILLL